MLRDEEARLGTEPVSYTHLDVYKRQSLRFDDPVKGLVTMSDLDVFVIDDDVDPLADLELAGEEEQPETDYLPPIPDAELSRVPERVEPVSYTPLDVHKRQPP